MTHRSGDDVRNVVPNDEPAFQEYFEFWDRVSVPMIQTGGTA